MGAQGGMSVPGGVDHNKVSIDAALIRDQESSVNETTFANLQLQYEDSNRVVDFLEMALVDARRRQRVLSAAMEVLNEPQKAVPTPSLR